MTPGLWLNLSGGLLSGAMTKQNVTVSLTGSRMQNGSTRLKYPESSHLSLDSSETAHFHAVSLVSQEKDCSQSWNSRKDLTVIDRKGKLAKHKSVSPCTSP